MISEVRWPRELNALQTEKNTYKLRQQLRQFDNTCATNAHNTTKQRNALQILATQPNKETRCK